MKPFSGIFTPFTTPFGPDQVLDEAALRHNVARWMQGPLTGLVALGSNGEAPLLEDHEADRVVEIVRDGMSSDRPLIVGTGRESTRATIAATRRAASLGADCALVRTPSFFKAQMTSDLFIRHYTEVADVSPIPVLLYNVTMFTGVNLAPDAVARLSEHRNIVGLKESGSDIAQIAEYVARVGPDFTILAGSAATLFHAFCAGCDGAVLALASLVPDACFEIQSLVAAGRIDEARTLQRKVTPLARTIGTTYGIAGLKAAYDLAGLVGGVPRPPLRPAAPAVVDVLREQLGAFGVLASTGVVSS